MIHACMSVCVFIVTCTYLPKVIEFRPALQYWTLLTCTLIALQSFFTKKLVENVKLLQIVAKIDFS